MHVHELYKTLHDVSRDDSLWTSCVTKFFIKINAFSCKNCASNFFKSQ